MTYSDGTRSASTTDGESPAAEGHRERLRQRIEREGWDALKPSEMVEVVLYHAVPRQDLSGVARRLVERFGSVGGVFAAPQAQLRSVAGMTDALAAWVRMTGELMHAYRGLQGARDIRLSCWREMRAFLRPRLAALAAESAAWVVFADFDFSLIACIPLGAGDWWDAANARAMLTDAIDSGARYVFLVLLGDDAPPEPDAAEIARLEAIAVTLRAAEIDLMDCLTAGGGVVRSMNREGRMRRVFKESAARALRERYIGDGEDAEGR